MMPPVKYVLPPRKYSGAFSSTSTLAPCSRAAIAAHRAALPAPTINRSDGLSTAHLIFVRESHRPCNTPAAFYPCTVSWSEHGPSTVPAPACSTASPSCLYGREERSSTQCHC